MRINEQMARTGQTLDAPLWTPAPSTSAPSPEAAAGPLGGHAIRLPFTLLGIPLLLDWSFLVVLPLMAFLIGRNVVHYALNLGITGAAALASPTARYALGLLAALGLWARRGRR